MTPRIIETVVAIGLLYAVNERAPGLVQAALLLVALYLALTHAEAIGRLVDKVPRDLGSALPIKTTVRAGPHPTPR